MASNALSEKLLTSIAIMFETIESLWCHFCEMVSPCVEVMVRVSASVRFPAPRQVWNHRKSGDSRLVRTVVKTLRRKLDEDAAHPVYIFKERRVGYRMPRPDDL